MQTITLPTMKAYESPLEALNREKQAQKEREEAARRFIEVGACGGFSIQISFFPGLTV